MAAKKTSTKAKASSPASKAARISAMAVGAITKMTKGDQKPLGFNASPLPVVPSGSVAIDNLIGGNPSPDGKGAICPGYPRQHITEIYGAESSGKTTLALEAIARVQRQGGVAMFLDFENALHHGYAKSIGVDFDPEKFLLYQPNTMEQGLDMIGIGIKAGVDLIVVDSVAAMVPKDEMEKNFEDVAKIGIQAAQLSRALPKIVKWLKNPPAQAPEGTALILINQTRAQIGGMSKGDGTSGGKALKFYAYLRLQAAKIQAEYVEKVNPVTRKKERVPFGNKTQVKVVKSKVDAKQGQTAMIFIRFGQGLDDFYTTIESATAHGIVKKGGAYYEYDGHRLQGRERFRAFLKENRDVFEALQDNLLKAIRGATAAADTSQDDEEDEEDLDALISSVQGDGDDEIPEEAEVVLDEGDSADE